MSLPLKDLATTPDGAINRQRSAARGLAEAEFGGSKFGGFQPRGSDYGFADLRPTHIRVPVGGAYATCFGRWTHPLLAAGVETVWYNTNVHEDSIVLFFGMFNATAVPTIVEGKHYFGGEDLSWIHLEKLNAMWEPSYYFELGYVVGPKQPVQGTLNANAATVALTENIGYLGEILARRRYMITMSAAAP